MATKLKPEPEKHMYTEFNSHLTFLFWMTSTLKYLPKLSQC